MRWSLNAYPGIGRLKVRWCKHITATSQDPFIVLVESKFGLEGYARFWKLIEAIGLHMKDEPRVSLPVHKWAKLLRAKVKVLIEFLAFLEEHGKISIRFGEHSGNISGTFREYSGNLSVFSEKILEIDYGNILKYKDEYARKSGQDEENVRNQRQRQKQKQSPSENISDEIFSSGHGSPEKPASSASLKNHHQAFADLAIDLFESYYKTQALWGPGAFAQLREFLRLNPDLNRDEFGRRYTNMLTSPVHFHQQKLGNLIYFVNHFDEFIALPMTAAPRESKAEERERKNREAIERVRAARSFDREHALGNGNGLPGGSHARPDRGLLPAFAGAAAGDAAAGNGSYLPAHSSDARMPAVGRGNPQLHRAGGSGSEPRTETAEADAAAESAGKTGST